MFSFRCVLHPLPLSSCLGCIPPLIGLPSLRFYAVDSSLFLLSVCFCLCFLFYRDDVLCWLLPCPSFSVSVLISDSRFDLVWFRLSCDHGWIRSGSVNVRKQQQQQQVLIVYFQVNTAVSRDFWTMLKISAILCPRFNPQLRPYNAFSTTTSCCYIPLILLLLSQKM